MKMKYILTKNPEVTRPDAMICEAARIMMLLERVSQPA